MIRDVDTLWDNGPILNGWVSTASSFTAEIMGGAGFDAVTIDLQHGMVEVAHALPMIQAIEGAGSVPFVRVPWLDPAPIMKVLDAGAMGIICPMINTPEDAARLVSYCRYPPLGGRSFGPTRAAVAHGAGYYEAANDKIKVFAMVETAEALGNLNAIAATPGLDGIFIGPADLSISTSNGRLAPGADREEPEMIERIQKIIAAGKANDLHLAFFAMTPEYAARVAGWGVDTLTIANDTAYLGAAARATTQATRQLISGS